MEADITCPACQEKNPVANNYCRSCGNLLKTSLVGETQTCPFCKQIVADTDYNCPHCGRKIRAKPLSTTLMHQLGIYLLSVFLPPLGLWPGFKYLRQSDRKHKAIGLAAIGLTIVSILISALYITSVVNQVNQQVNQELQNLTF